MYQESSYMQNPKPGTYCKTIIEFGKPGPVDKSKMKYQKYVTKELKVKPTTSAPSIPQKETDKKMLTGKGQDSAGPGEYNPDIFKVKNNRSSFVGLAKSITKRQVF